MTNRMPFKSVARSWLVLCCLPILSFFFYRFNQSRALGNPGDAFKHSVICPTSTCSWASVGLTENIHAPADPGLLGADSNESCLAICPPGITNGRCQVANADASLKQSLRSVHGMVTGPSRLIPAQDILSLFRLEKDPCRRGPTGVTSSGVTNFGDDCYVRSEFGSLQVAIQVPAHLEGVFARSSSSVRLSFPTDYAPVIHIFGTKRKPNGDLELSGLDRIFGGTALWVESDTKRVFFKTRGCIGVGLN
jgi:hypothetical protein